MLPLQASPLAQVLAQSSQYFERTFNRLVAAPPVLEAPLLPVAPAPPVVTVEQARTTPVVPPPTQVVPVQPNIAVAIATAQAAPVATILLPPYPFGPPPQQHFEIFPPINVIPEEPKKRDPEPTTTTQRIQTTRQPENVNQASNVENFGQGLPSPSSQNVNFKQYYAPPVPSKPQKLKTSVEVVPVPLAYIAPPPIKPQPIKYVHTFIPSSRIIIRPVRYATVRVPARLVIHKRTVSARYNAIPQMTLRRPVNRDVEQTTLGPLNRQNVKPPRQ